MKVSFSNYVRAADWWSNKLPTLLAVGYATILSAGASIYDIAPYVLFLLLSLIIGAVYVSIINDITDIDIDLANGKRNRMSMISPSRRWLFPILCLLIGVGFGWLLWPDRLSICLYLMSWITFSLYSIPPFRLKTRGAAGAIADACGAHLFPSLFMVSALSYKMVEPIDLLWFVSVGIWAIMHGLRGILWHQYRDRNNDIATDTNTLASKVPPNGFRPFGIMIFIVELVAFGMMLMTIGKSAVVVFLFIYFAFVGLRYYRYGWVPIIVLIPKGKPYQILMQDFYQFFLPTSLLLVAVWQEPKAWPILAVHFVVFPKTILDVAKDIVKLVFPRLKGLLQK